MVPYARLSGSDGMRLSRAAFGVMIKFSELFEAFVTLVDEVDMQWAELEGDEERDFKMKDMVKKSMSYEGIFKRWEMASKMRQWINETKKEYIERIRKELENESGMSETEKDDLADQKLDCEMQQTYAKVVEKAEFLVKLVVPAAYLVKDDSKKKGTILLIKEAIVKQMDHSDETQESKVDWRERLKNWKQIQTSTGAIKSFTEKKKEIFESAVMSILACL